MEPLEDRLARQREDRKREAAKREVARKAETGAAPVSRARREEARQTFRELRGHQAPVARPRPADSLTGAPIEVWVWKEGVAGKISIPLSSDFTPL